MANYTNTSGSGGDEPVVDKEKLLPHIAELIDEEEERLRSNGFEPITLIEPHSFTKLDEIKNGANAVSDSLEDKKRFSILAREIMKMFRFTDINEVGETPWAKRDAIRAIYHELTKRIDIADTTEQMVALQQIVNDCVSVSATSEDKKASTKFDISKINFDKLSAEFARVKRKELLLDDFSAVLEERVVRAMKENPLRVDFYQRYEQIIDGYNAEQDKATIEKTFIELIKLSEELDEKQKEYIREGFTSEQQISVFELLFEEDLSKADIKTIKAVAIELNDAIEERLAEMVSWTEKDQTKDTVRTIIRDCLWKGLPEDDYSDQDIVVYAKQDLQLLLYPRQSGIGDKMANSIYKPVSLEIGNILKDVQTGKIGLPDLQRPFVWKNDKVRQLLDSMLRGYPIGYIMLWESPADYSEKKSSIGTNAKTYEAPKELVIDGQQRITALLSSLYGVPVKDKDFKERTIRIAFDPIAHVFENADAATDRNPRFISSVSEAFAAKKENKLSAFRKAFIRQLNEGNAKKGEPALTEEEEDLIEQGINDLLGLELYLLPTLEITADADEEMVSDIFVRVNSQGQSLKQDDFIMTLLSVYEPEMRSRIEKFCADSHVPADGTSYNHLIKTSATHIIRAAVGLGFKRGRLRYAYQILRGKDLKTGETTPGTRPRTSRSSARPWIEYST